MSNLVKLEFAALDITGRNYLEWVLDAEIHLDARGLGNAIKKDGQASSQDKAKAMIFLRHHLHESLKAEYLTVKDPLELWSQIKERYEHQKTVILPKARYDWIHLRLQDFKTVGEYNSAIFKISSQLKLCGEKITDEDLLEKTFSTFHASNVLLQQQYREKGFKKYSELISCLLVAEQNNELLMKNHVTRPTGSAAFPEANAAIARNNNNFSERRQNFKNNFGPGRGRGRGHGRGRGRGRGGNNYRHYNNNKPEQNEGSSSNPSRGSDNTCHRCGMKGHWARLCRTPRHFVTLYKNSRKETNAEANLAISDGNDEKSASVEANLAYNNDDDQVFKGLYNITNLDVADFEEKDI